MVFVELDPHQLKAVDQLDNGKILWGGVGTGKSRTALAYFWKEILGGNFDDRGSHSRRCDLYVITTAKKRDSLDWSAESARFGIVRDRDSSVNHTGFVVDSWNNLGKYVDVEDAFFIFDEQRAVGSGRWSKQFIKIAKANRWILLTATPGDTWMDYIPVFVANGFYKNRTEFKREHVVYNTFSKFPKVEKYIGTGRLVRHRNSLLVHMPYKRNTIRIEQDVEVDYDRELFKKVMEERWHVFENRPLRDVAELFSVMRKVVNTNPSRLTTVSDLLRTHPRLIVFYNFDYELEILRTITPTETGNSSSVYEKTGSSEESQSSGFWTEDEGEGEFWIPSTNRHTHLGLKFETPASSSRKLSGTSSTTTSGTGSSTLPLANDSSETEEAIDTSGSSGRSEEWRTKSALKLGSSTTTSTPKNSSPGTTTGDTHSSSSTFESTTTAASRPATAEFEMKQRRSSGTSTTQSRSTQGISSNTTEAGRTPTSASATSGQSSATPAKPSTATFTVAEWNGHKHQPIPETDSWVYLVQYQAGAEGWNCTSTNAICFYSPTYSYKLDHQSMGRIDRLNTLYKHLYYYRLLSNSYIDKAIMKALNNKQSFNESAANVRFVPMSESSADAR